MDEKMDLKEIINLVPAKQRSLEIANDIINEEDVEKVKDLTNKFNLEQAKKNTIWVLKLNELYSKVIDSMTQRFDERPGEFSNSDLIGYMTTIQTAIEKLNKSLVLIDEAPVIQVNQLNIGTDTLLNKESRDKIFDAVRRVLKNIEEKEDVDEVGDKEQVIEIMEDEDDNI